MRKKRCWLFLCPVLLGVFAARVEVSCELVQVASYPAALDEQGGNRFQCILPALCDNNGVSDVHTAQEAADKRGLGEVELLTAVFNAQLFFCGHSGMGNLIDCLTVRCIANLYKYRFYPMQFFC